MTFDSRLPDDLDEISRSLPAVPRSFSRLRQLLALLPNPIAAGTQPSMPVDEVQQPESAQSQMASPGGIGRTPGTTLMDNAVGTGQIRDGAVTGAVFAATVRPVYLVTSLPALPNTLYPIGQFVLLTTASPPTMYENVANAWVKAIGAEDIKADSITAGVIAAGAIGTSELAVGARLTGEVANESGLTPGVFIDSTGILIRSGKLTLQDEFGLTTLFASGFSGSWFDLLSLGLYNSRFTAGVEAVNLSGRTANCPYWDISPGANATLQLATVGSKRCLQVQFLALDSCGAWSDKVPVGPMELLEVSWTYDMTWAAGSLVVQPYVYWYKENGLASATPWTACANKTSGASLSITRGPVDVVAVPSDAAFARLVMLFGESGTHNAANRIRLYSASLTRKASARPLYERIPDAGKVEASPGSGTFHNYNLGAAGRSDSVVLVAISPGADSTLTGIVAPSYGKRLLSLLNSSGFQLLLAHDDAGSTAANRLLCPGDRDYLLPRGASVTLYYDEVASRWRVLDVGIGPGYGTAFPTSVHVDDVFFRTDLGMQFQWNGTRWLCTCPHQTEFGIGFSNISASDTNGTDKTRVRVPALGGGSNIWIKDAQLAFFVASGGTALGASHNWVVSMSTFDTAGTLTTFDTFSINSGASNDWRELEQVVNALMGADQYVAVMTAVKTGTPGNLYAYGSFTYRHVAT